MAQLYTLISYSGFTQEGWGAFSRIHAPYLWRTPITSPPPTTTINACVENVQVHPMEVCHEAMKNFENNISDSLQKFTPDFPMLTYWVDEST